MKAIAAVALIAAVLVPSSAFAKEGLELSSLPDGLAAGQPWDTNIRALPPGGSLPATHGVGVQITNVQDGKTLDFPAAPNGDGTYRVRVVFPSAGRWDYQVVGIGTYHQQNWAPAQIVAPAAAVTEDSGSSFPWGWVAGGGAGLALIALVVARFRPWRSSPSGPSAAPPPSSS
jgi:hypothetical protein